MGDGTYDIQYRTFEYRGILKTGKMHHRIL